MCEDGVLKRIAGLEALARRNVQLDALLWDDGWDDPKAGLWMFNKEKFPNEFKVVAERAKEKLGAGLSVWLSPFGGYGQAKRDRLKHGKAAGLETNKYGFSMAGPKYAATFKSALLNFRK